VVVVAAAVLLTWGRRGRPTDAATQTRRAAGPGEGAAALGVSRAAAVALARLQPAAGLILVGVRPGMRVDQILVQEGSQVSKDQPLATLEGREAAHHQVVLAQAQKKRAEHQRSARKDALTIERAQSDKTRKARIDAASKAASASKQRFDKATELLKQFGGTLQGKERYDAEMALFQVEMQAIKTDLDQKFLEAALEAESTKRKLEDWELADHGAEDEILDAQIKLAGAGMRETEVRAAGAGRVLRMLSHPGEVSTGTLMELGDVSSMVAIAEVYQSDLPGIRVGDPADVDILGNRVAGKVTRIGSIVGRNQLTSVDPRALRDLRVVEVMIQLDDSTLAAHYVNMEVEATIHPSGTMPTSQTRETTASPGAP
jgi:HlyD family secretion protein